MGNTGFLIIRRRHTQLLHPVIATIATLVLWPNITLTGNAEAVWPVIFSSIYATKLVPNIGILQRLVEHALWPLWFFQSDVPGPKPD